MSPAKCQKFKANDYPPQGVSYSLATLTVPSLLALPSATQAHHAFARLQKLGLNQLRIISAISGASLLLCYVLAPRQGRHPYLLWTASTVALGASADLYFSREARQLVQNRRRGDAVDSSVNGEEVRAGMEQFQIAQAVRAGISGLGFLMSVIGLWGDGY